MENQQVTAPTSDKTPEEIEREMLLTRESLTNKVAALENQVVGTVQTAADTLTGTVESVKSLITTAPGAVGDTVKQAASAVSEKMKEVFDISGHVREHPLAAVGISMLAGGLTGYLLGGGRAVSSDSVAASSPPAAYAPPAYAPPAVSAAAMTAAELPRPSGPGVFDELFSMLGRKLREVAETVIDTATAAVNKNVQEGVPKLVDAAAERLTPDTAGPSERRFSTGADFHG